MDEITLQDALLEPITFLYATERRFLKNNVGTKRTINKTESNRKYRRFNPRKNTNMKERNKCG